MKRRAGPLEITVNGDREIAIARDFEAPSALVFDAHTKPELMTRWFGPRRWTMTVCDIDLRVGGRFRFAQRGPDGTEIAISGVYREIARPDRLVVTEAFDDPWYEGESLVTTTFAEHGAKTTLTTTIRYESKEIRDVVLRTAMERGLGEGYDKLVALLASIATSGGT